MDGTSDLQLARRAWGGVELGSWGNPAELALLPGTMRKRRMALQTGLKLRCYTDVGGAVLGGVQSTRSECQLGR